MESAVTNELLRLLRLMHNCMQRACIREQEVDEVAMGTLTGYSA